MSAKYSKIVADESNEIDSRAKEQELAEIEDLKLKIDQVSQQNYSLQEYNQKLRVRGTCLLIFLFLVVLVSFIALFSSVETEESLPVNEESRFIAAIPPRTFSLSPTSSKPLASSSPSPSLSPSLSTSLSPSPSLSPSLSTSLSISLSISLSRPANSAPPSPSFTPAPSQEIIAVVYDGKIWWDGKYDTFPEPITAEFSGPPAPEAVGKYAYVSMITGYGKNSDQYPCLGLVLFTSLAKTNPNPDYDRLVVLLIDDHDDRFRGIKEGTPEFEKIKPAHVLGDMFYNALTQAGVNKWIIWRELETDGREGMVGGWKQAFSKLKLWTLVQYEKLLFMDSDTMVLKNLDHLFQENEFTSAPTWNCKNSNSPLKPSGGFWVIQPSLKTWGLIEAYIGGRDPCAANWRLGDMTMTWVLFLDVRNLTANTPDTWQKYDGDFTRWGRCAERNMYPSRMDFISENINFQSETGVISSRDRWTMLNTSYDVLVPICDYLSFYYNTKDDRYNYLRGEGKVKFDRPDAFSVHFSCGHKPRCLPNESEMNELGQCARDMFNKWYEMLHVHYRP